MLPEALGGTWITPNIKIWKAVTKQQLQVLYILYRP